MIEMHFHQLQRYLIVDGTIPWFWVRGFVTFCCRLQEIKGSFLMNLDRDHRTTLVLMTPPVTMEERYGPLASAGNCTPCLALLILAAIARQNGYTVAIIDAAAEGLSFEETMERLSTHKPRSIGFTLTTLTTQPAERFALAAKQRWNDLIVFVGGPHPTAIPEETLHRCKAFDAVAIHEGDETILDLLERVDTGRADFSEIPGIVYREGDGTIHKTTPRPAYFDLDRNPFPAWELLEGFPQHYSPGFFKVKQLPSASFVSSRGCPFECSFCDTSVFGQKIRTHSAEYMAALFEHLHKRFGVRDVTFEDDTFMVYRKNVERFCTLLLEKNLGMTWACNSRVNLAKPELLQLMKRAGCWHISYGIESGSQEILNHESKQITIEQIEWGVRNTVEAGIAVKGFFIVGHPHETQETLLATWRLTQQLPFTDISVTCMTPFPGSPLYQNATDFGTFNNDWTCMNLLSPVFVPHGLTANGLQWWQRKILRSFYFRPRTIINYTGRIIRHPSPQYVKGIFHSAIALGRTVFRRDSKHLLSSPTGTCN